MPLASILAPPLISSPFPLAATPSAVREFATFTPDLHQLAAWLKQCAVDTVVMESTGVYWVPVFELLEQRGFTSAAR